MRRKAASGSWLGPEVIWCILIFVLLSTRRAGAIEDGWWEEAAVLPVASSNSLLAHFRFSARAIRDSPYAPYVSPAVWNIIDDQDIQDLELTSTKGRWPVEDSTALPVWLDLPSPGLSLSARFAEYVNDTRPAFKSLSHTLSSLFGAAVPTLVDHGVLAVPAVGWFGNDAVQRQQIHGWLIQEAPCSDSIAAWLKLLPCRHSAGLAGVLGPPEQLVKAPLYSMRVQIRRLDISRDEAGASHSGVGMDIEFTMMVRHRNRLDLGGHRSGIDIFSRAFTEMKVPACPVARTSTVYLPVKDSSGTPARAAGCQSLDVNNDWQYCRFNSEKGSKQVAPKNYSFDKNPVAGWSLAVASRMVTRSTTVSRLTIDATVQLGSHPMGDTMLHIMQLIPWEIPVQWHALRLVVDDVTLPLTKRHPVIVWKVLRPAVPRVSGSLIEILFQWSSKNTSVVEQTRSSSREIITVQLQLDLKKQPLSIFDQSPDASRGIDVPAAVLTLVPPVDLRNACGNNGSAGVGTAQGQVLARRLACGEGVAVLRRRTAVHLLNIPIADASMPFNVVCFTSTAIAVAFSSGLNAILRRPGEPSGGATKNALKNRIRRIVLVLIFVGGLALWMDPDLQRKADSWLGEVFGVHVLVEVPNASLDREL